MRMSPAMQQDALKHRMRDDQVRKTLPAFWPVYQASANLSHIRPNKPPLLPAVAVPESSRPSRTKSLPPARTVRRLCLKATNCGGGCVLCPRSVASLKPLSPTIPLNSEAQQHDLILGRWIVRPGFTGVYNMRTYTDPIIHCHQFTRQLQFDFRIVTVAPVTQRRSSHSPTFRGPSRNG